MEIEYKNNKYNLDMEAAIRNGFAKKIPVHRHGQLKDVRAGDVYSIGKQGQNGENSYVYRIALQNASPVTSNSYVEVPTLRVDESWSRVESDKAYTDTKIWFYRATDKGFVPLMVD